MESKSQLFLIILLCLSAFFLFGCTDTNVQLPFTFNQLAKYIHEPGGADFNFVAYYAGDYNGLCIAQIDINQLHLYDCNMGGGGSNSWNDLNVLNNVYNDGFIDGNNFSAKVIYNDLNRSYGIMFCNDGNIIMGYLVGFSC